MTYMYLQYKIRNYPIPHFIGTVVTYRRKTVSSPKQPGHAATVASCSLLIASSHVRIGNCHDNLQNLKYNIKTRKLLAVLCFFSTPSLVPVPKNFFFA